LVTHEEPSQFAVAQEFRYSVRPYGLFVNHIL